MMNKRVRLLSLYVISLATLVCPAVYSCTTFVLRQGNHLVVGHNLDWISGTGLLIVNPRNLEKFALVDSSEHPIRWISRFGSITFNQVGRELPFGGMNETGLVVEQMSLNSTVYPSKDGRSAVGACQWIQFQLDNYSTVEEVISSDTLVRIVDGTSKFHFLICDRFGHAAIIEFLNGKMVCRTGNDLPVEALANSTYEESLSCYRNLGDTQSDRSLYNFCTAARQTHHPNLLAGDSTISHAFTVLDSVSQGLFTKWSIVYDITNMKIYSICFETPTIVGERKIFVKKREDAGMKVVDLKGWNFNCTDASHVLDLDCPDKGTVNQRFVKYSADINKEFIAKAFTFYKGWGIGMTLTDEQMDSLAKYPESFKCVAGK